MGLGLCITVMLCRGSSLELCLKNQNPKPNLNGNLIPNPNPNNIHFITTALAIMLLGPQYI